MMVVVAYDVNTETAAGRRRLRRVAIACQSFGQRVQYSVFECMVNEADYVRLQARLKKEMDAKHDSVLLYVIEDAARRKIVHLGVNKPREIEEPLLV
jgi:CRISPR-associated protein Cas2